VALQLAYRMYDIYPIGDQADTHFTKS
jgi:hypothetical protein